VPKIERDELGREWLIGLMRTFSLTKSPCAIAMVATGAFFSLAAFYLDRLSCHTNERALG
jgi:hypothetical protein